MLNIDPSGLWTINTLDIVTTTSYTLLITGDLGGTYPSSTALVTFHLTGCDSTTIINPTGYDVSYTFTYGDDERYLVLDEFTEAFDGACGPFFYNVSVVETTRRRLSDFVDVLPSTIRFSESKMMFTVDTDEIYESFNYQVTVQGNLPVGYNSIIDFYLNVIGCEPAIVNPPIIPTQYYYLGEFRLELKLDDVVATNTKCPFTTSELVYYAKQPKSLSSYASRSLPSSMKHKPTFSELWVWSQDLDDLGTYDMLVEVEVNFDPVNGNVRKYVEYEFELIINKTADFKKSDNAIPPFFIDPLAGKISLFEGNIGEYPLPKYGDD
mmetsp:Transcript_19172/g.18308  ORF Transcript_19172/g.18308 Transcript_19172/m.18308 type:complete len:323 (-) Transcript_19172:2031-2999(-)